MTEQESMELSRARVQSGLLKLVKTIGPVQIGSRAQFPFGWRKAAKGRTVWRLLEEIIVQNLEQNPGAYGFSRVTPSDSEVSVYDLKLEAEGLRPPVYINIKSAVVGSRTNKDDMSKAEGLLRFFKEDGARHLLVVTFLISFRDDMTLTLDDCKAMPIAWLPDIYVNPSNNGNLQSSKYKDIQTAIRRTSSEFLVLLEEAAQKAKGIRRGKISQV